VDVRLNVTNILFNTTISFKIEALNGDNFLKSVEHADSTYFTWEGITEVDVLNIKPGETKGISLKAIFFEKGVYDILKFKFTFFLIKKTKDIVEPVPYKDIVMVDSIYETKVFNSLKEMYLVEID